jgi:hypothetical protein
MSKWFSANKLSLNLEKTNVIKFVTKISPQYPLNTKFLGLQIDNQLNWENHI